MKFWLTWSDGYHNWRPLDPEAARSAAAKGCMVVDVPRWRWWLMQMVFAAIRWVERYGIRLSNDWYEKHGKEAR